jgi:hypothetical protein
MEELNKLVSEKVGISDDMAKQAVEVVIGYLKDKLPAPIAGQIAGLQGSGGGAKDPESMAKTLGGLLGK